MKRLLLVTAALAALGTVALAQQGPGTPQAPGMMGPGMMGPSMMIQQMDTNGDGVVSADEMAARHQTMFRWADEDGNGTVSREEFTNRMGYGPGAQTGNTYRDQRREERRTQNFNAFDRDGDGLITEDEWAGVSPRGPMMGGLDRDGDGALSAEELEQVPQGRGTMMGPGSGMGPGMGPGGGGGGPRR